jgi:hypothetical protein
MTAKRDLKNRVRERQAKTGESYTAARRHIVGAVEPPSAPIPVEALVDLTGAAATAGLRCKLLMSEALTLDATRVLTALRDILLATLRDPAMDWLRALGLHGSVTPTGHVRPSDPRHKQFVARVRAGFGGTSPDGRAIGFHVDGVPIVAAAWRREPTLVVCALEESLLQTLSGLGTGSAPDLTFAPTLVFEGTRHRVLKPSFVIGRHPTCDLAIRDGTISRRHAEVLRTPRGWFIKDLDSEAGIFFKGMQISNKRIDEGDVFHLGPYELRFTFRS